MSKRKFRETNMRQSTRDRLDVVNSIIEEYQADGYVLTLRQLYYQLVSRDIVPNKQSEYSKLSTLLKEGRMAGIVDWDAIEDRLRVPQKPSSFDSPKDVFEAALGQYALPRMEGQPVYLEVWVEKDALSGVLSRVTSEYHIPIMVNRGYSSVSAMYDAFMRFVYRGAYKNRPTKILYLGDFDPSGLDMIRDIRDRIKEFIDGYDDGYAVEEMIFDVEAIALTEDQVREYAPPPNPAKITDPRAKDFIERYGRTSYEVDALRPDVLSALLRESIEDNIDSLKYLGMRSRESADKAVIKDIIESNWGGDE